jgi:hypothetical protein
MNLGVQIRTVYRANQVRSGRSIGETPRGKCHHLGAIQKFYAIGSSECRADADFGRLTGKPEVIHLDVKPASRTSDLCQLTRYDFLDEW